MLKPEQMETLPVAEVSAARIVKVKRETALLDSEGRVAAVLFPPEAYANARAAFFDLAAALPEGVTVIGPGAEDPAARPADWPFPPDGPPPPMRKVLEHLMNRAEKDAAGPGDDTRKEAA